MGPGRSGFWFPSVRLSAFVVAVVVAGNLILHAARPSDAVDEGITGRSVDYLGKKKRKLEQRLKMFQRFIGFQPEEPPAPERKDSSDAQPAPPEGLALAAAPAMAVETPPAPLPVNETLPAAPEGPRVLAYVEPARDAEELPLMAWPPSPAPLVRREPVVPRALSDFDAAYCTPQLAASMMLRARGDPWTAPGNFLFSIPETAVDGILEVVGDFVPRQEVRVWSDEDESVISRILDFRIEARRGPVFTEFVERWVDRQQKYFSKFEDSTLASVGFDDGTADIDPDRLEEVQTKILWDTVRKTYLSKYRFRPDDRIRDDAFRFNEWRGPDFVLVPPILAGYLWYRGFERRASVGETWLTCTVEPLSKWFGGHDELMAGLTLEWSLKSFPVGVIVSAGLYEGNMELDFIGIGTSAGMARKALALHREGDLSRD